MKNKRYELAIILPCYNEEGNLLKLISNFSKIISNLPPDTIIILVNDGSKDKTWEEIVNIEANYPFTQGINLIENKNFGGAIKEGIKEINSEIYAYMPADNQITPNDFYKVFKELKKGVDIAKGIREKREDGTQALIISKIYNNLVKIILKSKKIKDVNGLPKIFREDFAKLILKAPCEDISIEAYFALMVSKENKVIVEVPVTFRKRTNGTSHWQRSRIATYKKIFRKLLYLRKYQR